MLSKVLQPGLALVLAAGMGIASSEQARADHGAGIAAGIAGGIIGLGILGAAASARHGYYYDAYGPGPCYPGPRVCNWEHRYCFENRYGDYVCRGGDYVCRRPLVCE